MIIAHFPKRFRIIATSLAFLSGITVGSWFLWDGSEYIVYAAFILLGLFFLFRAYSVSLLCLCLAVSLLGYQWSQWHLKQVTIKQPLSYTGTVRLISLRPAKGMQERVLLKFLEGEHKGKVLQSYVYDWTYAVGSVVKVDAQIEPSEHVSDRGRDVVGNGKINSVEFVGDLNWIYRFRNILQTKIGASLPEPYASLAVGLLTGVNDDFDAGFKEDLQRTGTTHIVAVSGYNLTIVALLLLRLGQRKKRWFGLILAIVSIVAYILLAGATPSILRGAAIALLSLIALASGRITHRLPLVLMSGVMLAILNPLGMLYSLSWQLSFLAFVGILFLNPVIETFFSRWGILGTSLSETLSAEIMVLPLLLWQFGTISLVSPLINLVILTLIPMAMALSALQAFISLISIFMGRIVAWITYPILWLIIKPIQWTSDLPFASRSVSGWSIGYVILSYFVIAGAYSWLLYLKTKSDV